MIGRRLVAGVVLAATLLAAGGPAGVGPAAAHPDDPDKPALDRLEQRSRTFYDQLEHGERQAATAAWPGLESDLSALAGRLRARLDRMRDDVMDRDGDLDQLYASPGWREPEIMSLVVTYHLAWVRYQGAQLISDAARRKKLLQQAVEGFSQFLLVNEVPEIYAESLYGRGLAFLDLGEYAKAIEDLTAAVDEPRVGTKARAALEEARRRAAGKKEGAAPDPESLLGTLGDLLPRAAAGDAKAEKDATDLARGLAARGATWPARVSGLVAGKLGDGTPESVHSSWGLLLLAQLALDRGRCDDVAKLAPAGAAVRDGGRTRHRPELLFMAGGCQLNGGHPIDAATQLDTLLQDFPDSPRAPEAAYYRFRALAVARTDDASQTPAYERALAGYLERYPHGEGVAEARWLLAELHRGSGDCARAEAEYAAVPAGPFASRARLGALECRVAGLGTDAGFATQQHRRETVAALRAFVADTPARGDDQARVARAALLGALVAAASTPPDDAVVVQLLDGFESRYPGARDLAPRARELRLGARIAQGDVTGAGPDLDALLAQHDDGAERRRTLARLGRTLVTAADRGGAEAPQSLDLARKVYAALADATGNAADRVTLADLTLRAGDAAGARRLYDRVLAADPGSVEARRGAARAAAASGDRDGALAQWRVVLDGSPPGGTSWYEARVAEAMLLAEGGRTADACQVLHAPRARATTPAAEELAARLDRLAPTVCR